MSATTLTSTYTTCDNDMLDAIAYKQLGAVDDALEALIAANPHVRELDEKLPAGIVLKLPYLNPTPPRRTRRIWDL